MDDPAAPSHLAPTRHALAGAGQSADPASLLADEIARQVRAIPSANRIAWLKTTLETLQTDPGAPAELAPGIEAALTDLQANPPKSWTSYQPRFREQLGARPLPAKTPAVPEPAPQPAMPEAAGTPVEAPRAVAPFPTGSKKVGFGREVTPELVADAPWRLEPGLEAIPLTFLVRDGDLSSVRLDNILVYQANQKWEPAAEPVLRLSELAETPGSLPVRITNTFWTHRSITGSKPLALPLRMLHPRPKPGEVVRLVVVFEGLWKNGAGRQPLDHLEWSRQQLQVYLAVDQLPLRDSPCWFYGDTHTHSEFTSDMKEFGSPLPDMAAASAAIGLDWAIITDHSVDLSLANPYSSPGPEPWDALGMQAGYDPLHRVRLLRGEEVSVKSTPRGWFFGKSQTLHLLVYGIQKRIPGAMWAAEPGYMRLLPPKLLRMFRKQIKPALVGDIHPLEDVLTGSQGLGQVSVLQQGGLAFAAHPATAAQEDCGRWEDGDDQLLQRFGHGMEAWNTRSSRYTARAEFNPYPHWKLESNWAENQRGIQQWERSLRQKVTAWKPGDAAPRFVLLAGTDAHGGFNYTVGWGASLDLMTANDNAFGKVRTLLYFPALENAGERQVPPEDDILLAIRSGRAVITDGPVVSLTARFEGQRAGLGDLLTIGPAPASTGRVEIDLHFASTSEFGEQPQQLLLSGFFASPAQSLAWEIPYQPGKRLQLPDRLPEGIGYLRASVETRGPIPGKVKAKTVQDTYRCFTNPVFLYNHSGQPLALEVNLVPASA